MQSWKGIRATRIGPGGLRSAKVSYETAALDLLAQHRPFQTDGQACDTGPNYHTAVFVRGPRNAASPARRASRSATDSMRGRTQVLTAGAFYPPRVPPGTTPGRIGPLWDVSHRLWSRPAVARDLGR